MERTSETLRCLSRAMPFSIPPLEGAGLVALLLIWLLA